MKKFFVVSIPLWFDSNQTVRRAEFVIVLFQFHSGSIQTWRHRPCSVSPQKLFQFHSGSIQTRPAARVHRHRSGRFNSTLVRFKPGLALLAAPFAARFNSTLVRFKPARHMDHHPRNKVSIPLWFDSNAILWNVISCNIRFQFHSGSIQTGVSALALIARLVSIPLWFDSNRRDCAVRAASATTFQFHSGSIQTKTK